MFYYESLVLTKGSSLIQAVCQNFVALPPYPLSLIMAYLLCKAAYFQKYSIFQIGTTIEHVQPSGKVDSAVPDQCLLNLGYYTKGNFLERC